VSNRHGNAAPDVELVNAVRRITDVGVQTNFGDLKELVEERVDDSGKQDPSVKVVFAVNASCSIWLNYSLAQSLVDVNLVDINDQNDDLEHMHKAANQVMRHTKCFPLELDQISHRLSVEDVQLLRLGNDPHHVLLAVDESLGVLVVFQGFAGLLVVQNVHFVDMGSYLRQKIDRVLDLVDLA
jgi:hypothetical protein